MLHFDALIYVPATLFGIGWVKDATAVRRRGDAGPRLRVEAGVVGGDPGSGSTQTLEVFIPASDLGGGGAAAAL